MTKKASARASRIPGVKELQNDPSFRQILELDFNDMIPFVLSNIKRRGIISFFYALVNIGSLVAIVLFLVLELAESHLSWISILKQFAAGVFTGSILVIPVHEFLHGMAFWILGSKKITYGADMQQLIFFVTADRFPVSGRELLFLAKTPFLVINTITIIIVMVWLPQMILFSAFFLISHNLMCIGDFAMVNYVLLQGKKIYTFDEVLGKKSYFYEKMV